MSAGARVPLSTLVPGELRGYRQFQLHEDGLYPLVHVRTGPWDSGLTRARCAVGGDHDSPASDCRCGLYAWYRPGSATVALGPVSAVIAARGRCVLGDRGFRAAGARIEAVALPAAVRWFPPAAARARQMLTECYPRTQIYTSVRRMLRDFPPDDVGSLGIEPPRDRSRTYRTAAVALWASVVAVIYALAVIPHEAVAGRVTQWWPMLVLLAVLWQAGLILLVARLLALQAPKGGPRRGP